MWNALAPAANERAASRASWVGVIGSAGCFPGTREPLRQALISTIRAYARSGSGIEG
jgi:hypothetical protein